MNVPEVGDGPAAGRRRFNPNRPQRGGFRRRFPPRQHNDRPGFQHDDRAEPKEEQNGQAENGNATNGEDRPPNNGKRRDQRRGGPRRGPRNENVEQCEKKDIFERVTKVNENVRI